MNDINYMLFIDLNLLFMAASKLREMLLICFLRIFTMGSRVTCLPVASAKLSPMALHCLITEWIALLTMSRNVTYYSSV